MNGSKDNEDGSLMFTQFKKITSKEFRQTVILSIAGACIGLLRLETIEINHMLSLSCISNLASHVVVELVLYVHGQQLRSCRDGQLACPHCSWASFPEADYQYLAPILSPLTDKCSS